VVISHYGLVIAKDFHAAGALHSIPLGKILVISHYGLVIAKDFHATGTLH
jgi:3D (Asp-Asp-Asp) domain-containing protein